MQLQANITHHPSITSSSSQAFIHSQSGLRLCLLDRIKKIVFPPLVVPRGHLIVDRRRLLSNKLRHWSHACRPLRLPQHRNRISGRHLTVHGLLQRLRQNDPVASAAQTTICPALQHIRHIHEHLLPFCVLYWPERAGVVLVLEFEATDRVLEQHCQIAGIAMLGNALEAIPCQGLDGCFRVVQETQGTVAAFRVTLGVKSCRRQVEGSCDGAEYTEADADAFLVERFTKCTEPRKI